jgi:hypothetical protein
VTKVVGTKQAVVFQIPRPTFVAAVLHNPFYAGAYAWGRRALEPVWCAGVVRKRRTAAAAPEQARVFIRDHHAGYIDWATFEKHQRMVRRNHWRGDGDKRAGAVRAGHGLLAGLLRCGRCGRRLMTPVKPLCVPVLAGVGDLPKTHITGLVRYSDPRRIPSRSMPRRTKRYYHRSGLYLVKRALGQNGVPSSAATTSSARPTFATVDRVAAYVEQLPRPTAIAEHGSNPDKIRTIARRRATARAVSPRSRSAPAPTRTGDLQIRRGQQRAACGSIRRHVQQSWAFPAVVGADHDR